METVAELKGNGFTPKALRESFRRVRNINDADQQEHDAIVDLYVASLTGARPAHARVENIEEFDAETGEIIEPQSAPQAARDLATSPSPQGQVETHSDIGMSISNEAPFPSADGGANIGGDHEVPAHPEPVNLDRRLQEPVPPQLGQNGDEHQRTEPSETNEAPAGRVADESPATNYLKASTGDAQFRDPLDWEDEDAQSGPLWRRPHHHAAPCFCWLPSTNALGAR